MIKNPFLNAVWAAGYIAVVAFVMSHIVDGAAGGKTILVPMAMLGLFVLSAAVMGCLFVYTPAKLFLDNRREEALVFFAKTAGTFALFVAIFFALAFLR